MSGKTTIEFPDGPSKWLQYKVKYFYSKRGNFYAKLARENSDKEEIYVWKRFEDGTPVLTLKDGKWVQAGRVVYGTVFIGGKDELSYEEYLRSPEGIEASKQLLKSLRRPEASEG